MGGPTKASQEKQIRLAVSSSERYIQKRWYRGEREWKGRQVRNWREGQEDGEGKNGGRRAGGVVLQWGSPQGRNDKQ